MGCSLQLDGSCDTEKSITTSTRVLSFPTMARKRARCNVSTASTAVGCAEKIVLLELISQLPGQPPDVGSQSLPREPDEEDGISRVLSFQQENKIVSTLAFLSGVSNYPDHITAVCLEELPAAGGCKVLLAINRLNPNSGQDVLDKIQRGFEQIFRRLSNLSSSMFHQPSRRAQ